MSRQKETLAERFSSTKRTVWGVSGSNSRQNRGYTVCKNQQKGYSEHGGALVLVEDVEVLMVVEVKVVVVVEVKVVVVEVLGVVVVEVAEMVVFVVEVDVMMYVVSAVE